MSSQIYASLQECFGTLEDSRHEMNRVHLLMDLVVITICAVICGADDWEAVAGYGQAKHEWLSDFPEKRQFGAMGLEAGRRHRR
jgi:hypothetical protein